MLSHLETGQLSREQIESFINEGFIKIDNAFPTAVADECRDILWKATKCNPDDPRTWIHPVIRIPELAHEPFKNAANTPILHNAFDQLAGKGNWLPRMTLGSFPIRFPSNQPANDTGWHVDASFPGDNADNYLEWRININSKGRALLMLFLFSNVSERDAPTVIKPGSHLGVAKILKPAGAKGLSFMELAKKLHTLPTYKEALATGSAGTVYLCHPFIVHAAQDHRGETPKFMAQPPLLPREDFNYSRSETDLCPIEKAILKGIRE
jgi:Phytanoyl-CoA dioxygenase (PhyH)